jgi:hypothetical protein
MINMDFNIFESCNVRFSDICINLSIDEIIYIKYVDKKMRDKNRELQVNKNLTDLQIEYLTNIIIEINEAHHIPIVDNLRKLNIYQITGKLSLDFSFIETDLLDFYKTILKQISKIIYLNYNQKFGIIFYICCIIGSIDVANAEFFWSIYERTVINNDGVILQDILDMFKSFGFKSKNIVNFMDIVKEELDDSEYYIKLDKDNYNNSVLSNYGIDRVISLPRSSEFPKIKLFIKYYTTFRENVFNTILEFFNEDENIYTFKLINYINQMTEINENIIKPVLDIILDKLDNDTVKKIENKYNIKLYLPLPILVKTNSKYDEIDKKALSNIISSKYSENLLKQTQVGSITIVNHKILPLNIIKDIINNGI